MDDGKGPLGAPGQGSRAVLIVEDCEHSAETLQLALLGIPNLRVLLACSGPDALRILAGAGSTVGAIITDLNMPRMHGFELIRHIRADHGLAAIPVIVVSADIDPSTPERSLQMGAAAFFPKPFSPAEVRRKLEQLLNVTTE